MQTKPFGTDFESCHTYTERQWTVPPHNVTRVCVVQRQDIDHFYITIEDYDGDGKWHHRAGSAVPFGDRESEAIRFAERKWNEEKTKQEKEGPPSIYKPEVQPWRTPSKT